LEKLTGLTSLDLSGNQISDWRFLEKLTGLTSLNLSGKSNQRRALFGKIDGADLARPQSNHNQISDGRFLEKLVWTKQGRNLETSASRIRYIYLTGCTSLICWAKKAPSCWCRTWTVGTANP
jgi:hypothetical protein